MKKFLSSFLAIIMLLTFVSCSNDNGDSNGKDTPYTDDVPMSETEESTEPDAAAPGNSDGSQDVAGGNDNENNNDDNNNDGNEQADEVASVEDKNSNYGPLKSFY